MRQAILITAYDDVPQLKRLLDYFDDDFELFVHFDKRSKACLDTLDTRPNVHVYRYYKVPWGSVNHLYAIIKLMKVSVEYSDLEYFHLITGSDYPLLALNVFKTFCECHRHENYMEYFPLPRKSWDGDGGLERVNYYWLQPWLRPTGGSSLGNKLTAFLVKMQRVSGLKRGFPFFEGKLYGGGTYWSMSRNAIEYCLGFIKNNPAYLRHFKMTKIAEECCLPTLLANSDIELANNSLRYVDWRGCGGSPKELTIDSYQSIKASDALFARKIKSGVSDELIRQIQLNIEYTQIK